MEKGPKHWWWNAADLMDLLLMVTKAGADNLRLEFHPQDRDNELHLVDRRSGDVCGTYNAAHTCPPDCF